MIEGTVEALGEDGIFRGWLRDTRDPVPALVQIRHGNDIVAEALASAFRPDLLRGGHGHGHFGFLARARTALPPGSALFTLFLPRHEQGIPVRLSVPAVTLPSKLPVEALLQPETTWTGQALAASLSCLDLPAQRAAMGTRRFVDVSFRLILQRWPMREEAAVFVQSIDEGATSPDAFLVELLTSRERADLPSALPSPWDPAFPFATPAVKERA